MNINRWPYYAPDEIDAVSKVLQSGKVNYWTGEECKLFEKNFAEFIGVKHAIALANGTVALELALYALNIGPGDDVIVPCRTFIATASSVIARGARPIVADVDLVSQNITVETIRQVMTPNTKAIIAVHLAGWPCDMDAILDFARSNNLRVIEDCAQAHGAMYKGKHVGSFGDVAVFSFCQDKIMTTGGEGGMLVTNDAAVWERAWSYKDHGKSYDHIVSKDNAIGFRWRHESFGTNWRMTGIQAAIGLVQLQKLPDWVHVRRNNAGIFNSSFEKIAALRITVPPDDYIHSYYIYYTFVQPNMLKPDWNRDRIIKELHMAGIPCFVGSCPEIYLEKAFSNANLVPEKRFTVAKELGDTSLMFWVHPRLAKDDIFKICLEVKKIMRIAAK